MSAVLLFLSFGVGMSANPSPTFIGPTFIEFECTLTKVILLCFFFLNILIV